MMISTNTQIVALVTATLLPLISLAQDSKNLGYLVDTDTYGKPVVINPTTDLCLRTSDWIPASVVESCDPVSIKTEVPAPNVVGATPPPARRLQRRAPK